MPSNNIDILPTIHDGRRPQLSPPLIIGGAFFLGLVVMLFLNRAELGPLMSQFGALWDVEQNRPIIIGLLLRIVLTAVIFAAIASALFYLIVFVIRPDEERRTGIAPSITEMEPRRPTSAR